MATKKVFIDTNVIAYTLDQGNPAKQTAASLALSRTDVDFVLSTQVLLELYSVATKKLSITPSDIQETIARLCLLTVLPADAILVQSAISTSITHQISLWDAMILESAAQFGCAELWSEDFNTGATIRTVYIHNPFEDIPKASQ